MSDLLKMSSWKYVVTTAGSELPIHSHRKLRGDLEAANGFDIFVSFPFPYRHFERFNQTHEMLRYVHYQKYFLLHTKLKVYHISSQF